MTDNYNTYIKKKKNGKLYSPLYIANISNNNKRNPNPLI